MLLVLAYRPVKPESLVFIRIWSVKVSTIVMATRYVKRYKKILKYF